MKDKKIDKTIRKNVSKRNVEQFDHKIGLHNFVSTENFKVKVYSLLNSKELVSFLFEKISSQERGHVLIENLFTISLEDMFAIKRAVDELIVEDIGIFKKSAT
jgi:tetrahydromethanopterin S-methyltransferase subunit A